MKRIFLLGLMLAAFCSGFGSERLLKPPLKATEIFLPVGKAGQYISLMDLSTISVKEMETLTGKKLKFFNRVSFKLTQRQLRNSINNDGSFNKKKLEKFFKKYAEGDGSAAVGGFALGFILLLVGVLIAYLIDDSKKESRVRWAWIGCGVAVALCLLLIATGPIF